MPLWSRTLLGALNGLIFGIVAEALNSTYTAYAVEQSELNVVDMRDPLFMPAVSAVLFAAASYLLHRHWRDRPRPSILLWQAIGLAAVTAFALLDLANRPYLNRHRLSELFLKWVIGICLVAGINLIYGLLVQAVVGHYSREKAARLP